MSLFTVDPEKCKHDGICAAECPAGIIEFEGSDSVPVPAVGAGESCINCGHCVAVCPHEALSLKTMGPGQCPVVRKDLVVGPEQVKHLLRSRRSIRTYRKKPVDREIISRLIDAARYAPSGHNSQPVEWLVIHDSDELKKLIGLVIDWMRHLTRERPGFAEVLSAERHIAGWDEGVDSICRGAPHLIVAHAHKDMPPAPAACTIAMSYLDLAAHSFGLGACWAGYFYLAATMWPPLKESLALPDGNICSGSMMIGYRKFEYHRLPLRNEARVTWR